MNFLRFLKINFNNQNDALELEKNKDGSKKENRPHFLRLLENVRVKTEMDTEFPRIDLQQDYSISRVIKGGWQLAGGHGAVDEKQAIQDMRAFVKAGITTFDCADIYTGVEELIGKFIKEYKHEFVSGDLPPVQVHTKYVPDLDELPTLTKAYTETIINRSLKRLGVERLDMVQLHWWDYSIPHYVEAAQHLLELQKAGKIRYIGVTNFDASYLQEILGEISRIFLCCLRIKSSH